LMAAEFCREIHTPRPDSAMHVTAILLSEFTWNECCNITSGEQPQLKTSKVLKAIVIYFHNRCCLTAARGSVVVKTLCYKTESHGFDIRWR
jgi:hypothetical protein